MDDGLHLELEVEVKVFVHYTFGILVDLLHGQEVHRRHEIKRCRHKIMGLLLYTRKKLEECDHEELLEYIETLHEVIRAIRNTVDKNPLCSKCNVESTDELKECEDCHRHICENCYNGYVEGNVYGVREHFFCKPSCTDKFITK